jgi:hypothetical protein
MRFFIDHKDVNQQTIVSLALTGVVAPGTREESSFDITNTYSPRLFQNPGALPPGDVFAPNVFITSLALGSLSGGGIITNYQSTTIVLGGECQ